MDTTDIKEFEWMKHTELEPLDTPEKKQAFDWAALCLSMRTQHPKSKLWRMRARQALRQMEKFWGPNVHL